MANLPPMDQLPSLVGASWLARPETQAVFTALADAGFPGRAVGGAVRNALLDRTVVDVDIATPARPDEVMAAARAAGLSAVPTGVEHGTVTVIVEHVPYEVTTLRRDVETHGRHATVAFTDDWTADARRRDFTINALYCGADGALFDPLGGWQDLVQRRVRFIGEASERIREDYLRILRFFRFGAEYGDGPPDQEGLKAAVVERAGLACLSGERVRQELFRLLVARRGPDTVRLMLDYGLITSVLGQAPRPLLLARTAELEAGLGRAADPLLRLAALAVETREDAEALRARLRLSNDQYACLARVESGKASFAAGMPEGEAKAALYTVGREAARWLLLLDWARCGAPAEHQGWRTLWALAEHWQPPLLPVTGEDVLALGVPAGPRVGALMRALEAWWIAGEFKADRAGLLAKLRALGGAATPA
jgi:poly(A) polymerase